MQAFQRHELYARRNITDEVREDTRINSRLKYLKPGSDERSDAGALCSESQHAPNGFMRFQMTTTNRRLMDGPLRRLMIEAPGPIDRPAAQIPTRAFDYRINGGLRRAWPCHEIAHVNPQRSHSCQKMVNIGDQSNLID